MSLTVQVTDRGNKTYFEFNDNDICPLTGERISALVKANLFRPNPIPYLAARAWFEDEEKVLRSRFVDGKAAIDKLNACKFNILNCDTISISFHLFVGSEKKVKLKHLHHPYIVTLTHWTYVSQNIMARARLYSDLEENRDLQMGYIYRCLQDGRGSAALKIIKFLFPLANSSEEGCFFRGIIYGGLITGLVPKDPKVAKSFFVQALTLNPTNMLFRVAQIMLEINEKRTEDQFSLSKNEAETLPINLADPQLIQFIGLDHVIKS